MADVEQVARAGFEIVCGWCGSTRYGEAGGRLGACERCPRGGATTPVLTPQELDKIPLGLLQLDGDGRVLDHESSRHRAIYGSNLFAHVAPAAQAAGLQKQFRQFMASGEGGLIFSLAFRVEGREIRVLISCGRVCAGLSLVRVREGEA
jgi:hypothetical protein